MRETTILCKPTRPQLLSPQSRRRRRSMGLTRTEMCRFTIRNEPCMHLPECTYAHNESERELDSLNERVELGIIRDPNIFRNRPCFTHVATGTCPLDGRCSELHDDRASGLDQAWLNLYKFPQTSTKSDVHIDYEHDSKIHEIHYGDSCVGPTTLDMFDSFDTFANYLCNSKSKDIRSYEKSKSDNDNASSCLTQMQRLHIACQMNDHRIDAIKYAPRHIICGDVYMIVQERTFKKDPKSSSRMLEVEIPPLLPCHRSLETCDDEKTAINGALSSDVSFVVREIVSRNVGADARSLLWINTPEECIQKRSVSAIKKYINQSKGIYPTKGRPLYQVHSESPFFMYRSRNVEVQQLIRDVMWHRFAVASSPSSIDRSSSSIPSVSSLTSMIKVKNERLQVRFDSIVRGIQVSHWPAIDKARDVKVRSIPVPIVDKSYSVQPTTKVSRHQMHVWDAFLFNVHNTSPPNAHHRNREEKDGSSRLSIFTHLSQGYSVPLLASSSPSSRQKPMTLAPFPNKLLLHLEEWRILRDINQSKRS